MTNVLIYWLFKLLFSRMLCYVTIIYSRNAFQLHHITYCAHSFSFYTKTDISVYRKDLQIVHTAENNNDKQTFLLQHFSSGQDMPDLHYFIPDYDHVQTFIFNLDGQHILLRLRLDTIKNFQNFFSDSYYISFSNFYSDLRRHFCTINSKRLRHYTLLPFARPKQLILFRSPPMQRRQRMVQFISNNIGPVVASSSTLASCINLTDFRTMVSNVLCSSHRSSFQHMKIK